MKEIMSQMKQFIRDEEGASAVEYGVLVALIIAVCIATIAALGPKLNKAFDAVNSKLS